MVHMTDDTRLGMGKAEARWNTDGLVCLFYQDVVAFLDTGLSISCSDCF